MQKAELQPNGGGRVWGFLFSLLVKHIENELLFFFFFKFNYIAPFANMFSP